MTDPLLNYQTPAPQASTRLRTGTWIYLLVLGILYCLGGTCAGVSIVFVYSMMARAGMPAGAGVALLISTGMILLFSFGFGITYIVSALRLRRGSRAAAITALVIALLNAAVILFFDGCGLYVILSDQHAEMAPMILSLVMYLLIAAMNGVGAYLLIRVLRQMRRAAELQASAIT